MLPNHISRKSSTLPNHITRKRVIINDQYLRRLDQRIAENQRQFDEQQIESAVNLEELERLNQRVDVAIVKFKKRNFRLNPTCIKVALITALAITCIFFLNRYYSSLSSLFRMTRLY
ncbi:MAG: hypothetical protein HW387_1219 [Parachlamydiales bacterium]|nr:hypothetical protein [Parachlamydiales bacterium]